MSGFLDLSPSIFMAQPDRSEQLIALMRQRILILDGAMGTMIQRHKLGESDYRGQRFADWPSDLKGNNDLLAITQPQIIEGIHDAYLQAGADILETNTFNATRIAMADYGMEDLSARSMWLQPGSRGRSPTAGPRRHRTSPASSPRCWGQPTVPPPCRRT